MTNLRTTLTVGVVVVATIGAIAGFVLADRVAPDAARSRLAVDAAMIVALAVTVWVLLGPLTTRIAQLVEALRALARGEKHTRVDVADFAGLAEIARATNEVGASLCENDDPNLGPVNKRARERAIEEPVPRRSSTGSRGMPAPGEAASRPGRGSVQEISEHPEIGAVRVRPREATPAGRSTEDLEASRPIIDGESVSEARPARRSSSKAPTAPGEQGAAATRAVGSADVAPTAVPGGDGDTPTKDAVPGASASTDATTDPSAGERSTAAPSPTEAGGGTAVPVSLHTDPPVASASVVSPEPSSSVASSPEAPSSAAAPATSEPSASSGPPTAAARDTVIEPVEPTDAPSATAKTAAPTRDELESLFHEFMRAKKAAGVDEGTDVDFDAFAETIRGESERLIVEHACRGVRFEVALADGEVSLRPRLVR
jgi:hypothetical protein